MYITVNLVKSLLFDFTKLTIMYMHISMTNKSVMIICHNDKTSVCLYVCLVMLNILYSVIYCNVHNTSYY